MRLKAHLMRLKALLTHTNRCRDGERNIFVQKKYTGEHTHHKNQCTKNMYAQRKKSATPQYVQELF